MWVEGQTCIGGGRCQECGRCNRYETTSRKSKLLYLPDNFSPTQDSALPDGRPSYGAAFDIGTTTVVGMLWDLTNLQLIDVTARTNPQSTYGADVISRITYCTESQENLVLLRDKVRECLNEMLEEFHIRYLVDPKDIVRATVVGNTTMSHLFLGHDPSTLALAPFQPAFSGPVEKSAEEVGLLINPTARVYLLPNIAGHVGSDIVGVILA